MTNNPLAKRRSEEPPPDNPRDIDEYVKWTNRFDWVIASGRPYFINSRRRENGTMERFVDRSV
jgi:hypothetical protein